ncbi:hypothetical protein [Phenylobacterium sp.]|uniref:hypothetical protein n=1 Tax=Phenylobacterium sp. TaxID=1871053 RepID=UPI00286DBDF0|nr:hypothetical protein [Phenylobacterium sp.]
MQKAWAEEAAAFDSALIDLEASREAFQHYYRWLDTTLSGRRNDEGIDADKKLRQAILVFVEIGSHLAKQREFGASMAPDWGLEQREGIEAAMAEWRTRTQGPQARTYFADSDWMELLTEQFYLIAFRAGRIIESLPGMKGFGAVGVRNVRNQLIEHNDGTDSLVFNGGFAFGGSQGPVVAAVRTDQQPGHWQDAGLFLNAQEFARALTERINSCLASPPPKAEIIGRKEDQPGKRPRGARKQKSSDGDG